MEMLLDQGIKDNLVRWKRTRQGHVESFFLKANHPKRPRAIWLKFTIFSPKGRPEDAVAETWAIAFDGDSGKHVAVKRAMSAWKAELSDRGRFHVRMNACLLDDDRTYGSIETEKDVIGWDLKFTVDKPPLHLLPKEWMIDGRIPKSKTVTPHPDSLFYGRVRVNGETWNVDGWAGCQGHNWGKEHARKYAWVHCNQWTGGEKVCFEGLTGWTKIAGIPMRPVTLLQIRLPGEDQPWLAREKMTSLFRGGKPEVGIVTWKFEVEEKGWLVRGNFDAPRDDVVALRYVDPNSAKAVCLNSKIANGKLEILRDGREPIIVEAAQSAALEVLVRDPGHGFEIAC